MSDDDQLQLNFERRRQRRPPRPTLPPPEPPSWWNRCKAGVRSAVGRGGSVGRWVLRHGSEIKTAAWLVGLAASALLLGLGISSCQAEFGNYRLKLEQKRPPVVTKPWGYELKEGE